jgi:hypothetical protein
VGIRKVWVYFFYSASFILAPITQTEFYLPTVQDYPWGFFAIKGLGLDLFTILGSLNLREVVSFCSWQSEKQRKPDFFHRNSPRFFHLSAFFF